MRSILILSLLFYLFRYKFFVQEVRDLAGPGNRTRGGNRMVRGLGRGLNRDVLATLGNCCEILLRGCIEIGESVRL